MTTRLTMLLAVVLACAIPSCMSNRHLVFFTNTTFGVEVGAKPTTGDPVSFVLGYKRQEGVIDPLSQGFEFITASTTGVNSDSLPSGVIATPAGFLVQKGASDSAHSVLAKVDLGASSGGTGAEAAQWFATGMAAEILAKQPGITAAVSGRERIEVVEPAKVVSLGGTAQWSQLEAVRTDVENAVNIGTLAANDQMEAQRLLKALDDLFAGEFRDPYPTYALAPIGNPTPTNYSVTMTTPSGTGFSALVTLKTLMEDSGKQATTALAKAVDDSAGNAQDETMKLMIVKHIQELEARDVRLVAAVETLPESATLVRFWASKIALTENDS